MKRLVYFLAALAMAGCGDDTNPTPTPQPDGGTQSTSPSVSGIFPESVFLAREADVVISGFATKWDDSTRVDFGAGVTVASVHAASPTALVAHISVDAMAMPGPRDVTVTEGSTMEPYKGGFKLESPLAVTTLGTVAQGSAIQLTVRNLDPETVFDTTNDGNFFNPTFTNVHVEVPSGFHSVVANVTETEVVFYVYSDVTAPAGKLDLDVQSGPTGQITHFPMPGGIDIAARSAMALTAGTPVSGSFTNVFDSQLYSAMSGSGLHIMDFGISSSSSSASPTMAVLPSSGSWSDSLGIGAALTVISDDVHPFYVVAVEQAVAGAPFSLTFNQTAATATVESEPNDDTAHAHALTGAAVVVQNASLASGTDEDWFAVTISGASSSAPKHIRAQTISSAANPTDTAIDILAADGTTSLNGGPVDPGFDEDTTSDPITTNGTCFVHIIAGSLFDTSATQYQLFVRVQ